MSIKQHNLLTLTKKKIGQPLIEEDRFFFIYDLKPSEPYMRLIMGTNPHIISP